MSDEVAATNALLEWCSATRDGSRVSFRDAYEWLTEVSRPRAANAALHRLEVLGHLEIDWSSGTWAINPPALAYLPDSGGNAVAVGPRSLALRERLGSLASRGACAFTIVSQTDGPDAWFAGVADAGHLAKVAGEVGMAVEHEVSRRYSEVLAPVREVVDAARRPFMPGGVEVGRFDEGTLAFEPFPWRGGSLPPGAYEHRGGGPNTYTVVHADETTSVVERRVAIHYELARLRMLHPGDHRWVPLDWEQETGALLCDARTPMPLLHTRAAVMATGLLPRAYRRAEHQALGGRWVFQYAGVSPLTYQAIADSLEIPLPSRSSDGEP